jgi:anti-sigma-K factor RskA
MTLEMPPARVWERISAELGLASGARLGDPAPATDAPDATVTALPSAPRRVATAANFEADEPLPAGVVPLRRNRTPWLLAAAGIAGVAVGGLAVGVATDNADTEQPQVVAQVALDPLPEWDASGNAAVAQQADGTVLLTVELDAGDGPGSGDGYREVWLIDEKVEGMVSLGVLEGSSGTFVVPDGVDLAQFPVVDVSLEPVDGQPTHSGNSIVRGILQA